MARPSDHAAVTSTNCTKLSGNRISMYSTLRHAAADVNGAAIRRGQVRPPGSGAAGMSVPSSRANLARSAAASQMHSQNMPASTGTPARKTGSRAIPVTRPTSTTMNSAMPMNSPAIRWTMASQVRPDTTGRSSVAGPACRPPVAAALGARNDGQEPSEAPMKRPSALLPDAEAAPQPPPRPAAGGPVVERIAGWSARHRKTALFGWLLLVAGAVVLGNMLGTKNLNSYDQGQAGRAERVLNRPGVVQPPAETVLVQARHGARTVAGDPEIRRAIGQVTAALGAMPKVATGIESPLAPGGGKLISRDGRSALVMFNVAGKPDNADQTVAAAERAVAAVQAAHPGLRVAESGQGSVDRATNNIISSDFRHAEVTSVPITLVLLLGVFGALIAAGIPLLLAGTAVATAISLLAIP